MINYDYLENYIEECTLLSKDQLIGPNHLSLFDTIGLECNTTDFARATGGGKDYNAEINRPNDNKFYGVYALKDIDYDENKSSYLHLPVVLSSGIRMPKLQLNREFFIRPVLKLKSIIPFLPFIEKDNENHLILKLGSYPSTIGNNQIELEALYQRKILDKEKEYYLIEGKKEPVYKYINNYYVRAEQFWIESNYSNGVTYKNYNKSLWFIIEPITWYVDLENRLLISKNLITANTNYSTIDEKKGLQTFEETILYKYLNEILLKEIFMMDKKLSNRKDNDIIEEDTSKMNQNKYSELFEKKYNERINQRLKKIEEICRYLPEESKKIIVEKTNKILEDFEENVEYMKPTMNRKVNLTTKITDIKMIEPEFLNKLDQMIMLLSSIKELSNREKDVIEYKQLIQKDIKRIELTNTIKDKISNIIFYSSRLGSQEKYRVKQLLEDYIDEYEKNIKDIMHHIVTDEIELESNQNYHEEFTQKIDSLFEIISKEINKISPLIIFREILTNNKIEWKESNSLSDFLSSIRYDIYRISIKKYQDEYKKRFNSIIYKYISTINNQIENKKTEKISVHELEISLRMDLENLLNSILEKSHMIDVNNQYRFNDKIHTQLKNAIDLLNGTISEKNKENIDFEVITSKARDINNKYFKGTYLNIEELNTIKDEIIEELIKQKEIYKEKEINSLEEYNNSLYNILHILTTYELDISNFLNDYKEYKPISK